jgi:hypothetical protein
MVNVGLMDDDAEIAADPVLQLFAEQHDVALPAVVEPKLEAVHVVPDGTHEYELVAVPNVQTEEVLNKINQNYSFTLEKNKRLIF